MRILTLNPNTSTDMTARIVAEAQGYCTAGTVIVPATATFGCEVIASRASFAIAAYAALEVYANHHGNVDAVLLACFGDPGLHALREISSVPVCGLLEAALKQAARGGRTFATLTAGGRWVDMLNEMIGITPYAALSRGVFAVDMTGLDISRNPDAYVDTLQRALDQAIATGAEAVMLGGSALAGFGQRLAGGTVELIDPLEAALRLLQEPGAIDDCPRRLDPPRLACLGLSAPLADLLGHRGRGVSVA